MALYHVYSNAVPDGTATSVVRPSDWNSAHNNSLQIYGNTTGVSGISGTDIKYQAAGNVILSGIQGTNSVATVVISGSNIVMQDAAGNSLSAGTFLFSNTNGVSFGINGSTITASIDVGAAGTGGGGGGGGFTVADSVHALTNQVIFANGNNVTFGIDSANSVITASIPVPMSLGFPNNQVTGTNPDVEFVDANNVQFGASYDTFNSYWSVTASAQAVVAIADQNSNGTNVSAPVIYFMNSNGVNFGVSSNSVTASVPFANIYDGNNNFNTITDGLTFANSNGVTFGMDTLAGRMTASIAPNIPYSVSNGSTSSGTLKFPNTNGVSWATSTDGIRASVLHGFSASGGSSTFNNVLTFSNSANGVTFSNSNGQLVMSHSLQQLSNTSAITASAINTSISSNFAQTSAMTSKAGLGTTFSGTNVSATMNMGSNGLGLSLSAPTPGGGGAPNISAGTTSNNLQTIVFSNSNGVSFGLNGSTITAALPTGTTFAGTNISATMNNGANGLALSLSAPAPGGGAAINVSAGTTSNNLQTIYFSDGNGVSFGLNGSTVTASAAGGGGGVTLAEFEPVIPISTSAFSLAQNSLYVNTLIVPNYVAANYMMLPVIVNAGWTTSTPVTNSTAVTGSIGSASAGQTLNFFLFTDGTGGMESNLYRVGSTQLTFSTNISWSQSNSNNTTGTQSIGSSVGFTYGYPAVTSGTQTSIAPNSTVTTWGTTTAVSTNSSTFSTNGTSTSGWPGGTTNASWSGSRLLFMPVGSTLTPGEYWVGIQRVSTTAGGAVAGTMSFMIQSFTSYDSNSRWAPFGMLTSQAQMFGHPGGVANGMFTTSYNPISNYAGAMGSAGAIIKTHIAMSSTTNTSGTLSRFYNRFMAEIV